MKKLSSFLLVLLLIFSCKESTKEVIQKKLPELGATGSVIALDKKGNISMEYNTPGMYRASMNDKGELYAGIYKDE